MFTVTEDICLDLDDDGKWIPEIIDEMLGRFETLEEAYQHVETMIYSRYHSVYKRTLYINNHAVWEHVPNA